MSSSELLTDAYLIELLQRDAERRTTRRSNAPKPNTRFLRNIVRDVDSHNSALKAREEADARARQRRLRQEERPSRKCEEDEQEHARRKRRRTEREGDDGRAKDRKHTEPRSCSRSRSPQRGMKQGSDEVRKRSGKHRTRPRSRSRSPARSPRRSGHRRYHSSRSDLPNDEKSTRVRHSRQRTRSSSAASSASDLPEEVLGPHPLPANQSLPRGRGAFKPQTSSIETRFREGYDPKTDVREEEGDDVDDDWDRGLEAVRDRAKWRANGAERLRAAGFTEQEVNNWERGALNREGDAEREKDVRDVRWMRKGEGVREWDRGKGAEGKADWIGRLT